MKTQTCPSCGKIAYGVPTPSAMARVEQGEVAIVLGCMAGRGMPRWACPDCQVPVDGAVRRDV